MSVSLMKLQSVKEQIGNTYLSDWAVAVILGLIMLAIGLFVGDIALGIILFVIYLILGFSIIKLNLVERVLNSLDWVLTSKVYHMYHSNMQYFLPYDFDYEGGDELGLFYKRPTVTQPGAIAVAMEISISEFFPLLSEAEQARRKSIYGNIIRSLKSPYREEISLVPINMNAYLAKYDKRIQEIKNPYMRNFLFEEKEFWKNYLENNDINTVKYVIVLEVRADYKPFPERFWKRLKGEQVQYFEDNQEREEELLMELDLLCDQFNRFGFKYRIYNQGEAFSYLQEKWVSSNLSNKDHMYDDDITFDQEILDTISMDEDVKGDSHD